MHLEGMTTDEEENDARIDPDRVFLEPRFSLVPREKA